MRFFIPNFLIVGTNSIIGAILGLKKIKVGSILCIIAGITAFISIITLGVVWHGLRFYYIFLYVFYGMLFVLAASGILIGAILAYIYFDR